jgi:hypothetical protein
MGALLCALLCCSIQSTVKKQVNPAHLTQATSPRLKAGVFVERFKPKASDTYSEKCDQDSTKKKIESASS